MLKAIGEGAAKRGGDPASFEEQHRQIRDFRMGVARALPTGYSELPGNPGVDQMLENLGQKQTYTLYRVLAQYVHGGHASDRESVSPVDVGHGQRSADYAGEAGDVGRLFGRVVAQYMLDHFVIGIYHSAGAHARFVILGYLPAVIVDLVDGTLPSQISHQTRYTARVR